MNKNQWRSQSCIRISTNRSLRKWSPVIKKDCVWVKALACSWNICNDESARIPSLCLCTTSPQGFQTTFSTHWLLGTCLYIHRKPILEKAPPELLCGKETTYLKVTQQGQKAILREGAGRPCPGSELSCSGRWVPPRFLWSLLGGMRPLGVLRGQGHP